MKTEMKTKLIKNQYKFTNTVEDPETKDYKVSGYAMHFDEPNYNGEIYNKTAFNKFINDYYIKNKKNMPLTIMHETGLNSLIGRIDTFEIFDDGVFINATISKSAPRFRNIVGLIEDGVLTGFSTEGFAFDYKELENGLTYINEAALTRISVVDQPADAQSDFEIKNTLFIGNGFETQEPDEEENKEQQNKNPLKNLLKLK